MQRMFNCFAYFNISTNRSVQNQRALMKCEPRIDEQLFTLVHYLYIVQDVPFVHEQL
jgi:hypothetical protein